MSWSCSAEITGLTSSAVSTKSPVLRDVQILWFETCQTEPPQDAYQGYWDCTFETLCKEFGLKDPKVRAIAQIIHDADLEDEKFGRLEGLGLDRTLIGWAKQGASDEELLRRGVEIIEGLFHSLA
jgi:ChrB, C-terminal domain